MMKVLVACEESQEVTKAFRKLGHNAYSCDLQECSGGYPEWHIRDNVLNIINDNWDLLIAHPPCTYLSNAGAKHLYNELFKIISIISNDKLQKFSLEFSEFVNNYKLPQKVHFMKNVI